MRGFVALLVLTLVVVGAAFGCSSGLSTTDATTTCMQEQQDKSSCFDSANKVFNLCVSCYQRCGYNCVPQATCPATYLCPGDAPVDGGSL